MSLLLDFSQALPIPELTLLGFIKDRERFTYASETLPEWVLLGLRAGAYRYRLGKNEAGTCYPGDFVLCPPGVSLAREVVQRADFYTMRFNWKPPKPSEWQGKWTLRDEVRLNSTLDKMQFCSATVGFRAMKGWADLLLGDLLCQLAVEVQQAPVRQATPDRLMLRAEEMLRRDVAEAATLESLAGSLGLNPFQLSRRFRAAFGQSPSFYRMQLRIQKARRLLLETDWTTDRVAEACGFENAFYFSRVFKKQVGQPPRDYRRAHRI